jgi:signal transduction histidine kinase/ActR/RegA family two-component response regulator
VTERARANILLVDDRPENLLVLKATLASLGENLIDARSGKEALKYLLEEEFAVILLDVMMPDMDGFETARLIREREKSRHTPIIFVTAMLRDDADAFKGYSVGAVDYIMKPFQPEILRSKVSVFVDLFRKTEEIKRQADVIRLNEQREFVVKLTEAERLTELERERVQSERNAIHSILQHAPMGIARLNSKLIISDMNDVFAEQFALEKDDSVGKNLFDVIEWLPDSLRQAVEANHPCQLSQQKMVIESGEKNLYCDIATWPVTAIREAGIGTIFLALDVTERVKLDTQRKDFVATLAHDLQTPVIASDRALSLIMGKVTDSIAPETFKLVSMLKKNNENLLHMIESLLDVYHYEAGAQSLYFDDVDLKLLTTTCIDEIRVLASEQGLMVSAKIPDDLSTVLADRTAMRRVITNLLDNAIKFTPPGGTIEVRGYNSGSQVTLEVEDSGIGIPPADRAHLFERYWHGIGRKTFKNSNGLGLFLCKQIIDSHHGRIECESEVGKMTVFRICLPIDAKAKHTSEQQLTSPANLKK